MKISPLFVCLFTYFILLSFTQGVQNANKSELGPYRATLKRSEMCKSPPKPYEKNPAALFSSEIYTVRKKTMLRGNLTIVRVEPHVWVSAKGYILEDGKYRVMYVANTAGCYSLLMRVYKFALNVNQHKGCVPKGTYIYEDLDWNRLLQIWSSTSLYGSFLWRLQVGSPEGTTICWEYDTVTVPK